MDFSLSERLSRGLLLCDGATGTQLYAHGHAAALLEPANVELPDIVKGVHLSYLRAGAELIETNTFGANAAKLGMHGMASRVEELNRAGVALAKEAARSRRARSARLRTSSTPGTRCQTPRPWRSERSMKVSRESEAPTLSSVSRVAWKK